MDDVPVSVRKSTGHCDCYEAAVDGNDAASGTQDGVRRVQTTVVGFGVDQWSNLKDHLVSQLEKRIADPSFGGNQGYGPYVLDGTPEEATAVRPDSTRL
jgi:hypothetical protein